MSHPAGGWAEQDPAHSREALARAVREARAKAEVDRNAIAMLGLASQVDGLVALDANLQPLRPAIVWLDRRATERSTALRDAVGEPILVARTGLNPDASHTAPKAMWLKHHEPEHYRRAPWLAPVHAHLNGWLTGVVVQDHAHASSTPLWLQMKADVTGRAIRPVLGECATSTGAAMLAGVASHAFSDLDEAAAAAVELAREAIEPDPANAAVYRDACANYRALFDGVEGALA
jgi:sugar (pentulose or hexulose) kinase